MPKRKYENLDSIALELNTERQNFDNYVSSLSPEIDELITYRNSISDLIKMIKKNIKEKNRCFNKVANRATHLINLLHNYETREAQNKIDFAFEQQLRMQTEEQVAILEEQVVQTEDRLSQSEIEKDDLRDLRDSLLKRIDLTKEVEIHEMIDICRKFRKLKDTLSCPIFSQNMKGLKNALCTIKDTISLEEDEGVCVICKSERATGIIIPCGHLCLCQTCSDTLVENSDKCPYCQVSFESIHRVFVV